MKHRVFISFLFCCLLPLQAAADDEGKNPRPEPVKFYAKRYQFSKDWFTYNIPVWQKNLKPYKDRAGLTYLEIGVYEGRSFLWMLENILTHPSARATALDIFPETILEAFLHNLEISGFKDKTALIKGYSQRELRKLPFDSFDIIYVDASHTAADVLSDAVLSWDLLKTGGVMILDDYGLDPELPEELRPKGAIDAFITANRDSLQILHRKYQVILKKITNPCQPASHCSPIGPYYYSWSTRELYRQSDNRVVGLSDEDKKLLETFARSRKFGDTKFSPDAALLKDKKFTALGEKLKLDLKNLLKTDG